MIILQKNIGIHFLFQKNTGDKKMTLDEVKKNWSKQPIIIRILFILLIMAFIYDLVTGKAFDIIFSICLVLFFAAEIGYWLLDKKEK